MKCKNCGWEVEPNERKCPCCGQPINFREATQQPEAENNSPEDLSPEEPLVEQFMPDDHTEVQYTCPECGKEMPEGAVFCPFCGCNIRNYVPMTENSSIPDSGPEFVMDYAPAQEPQEEPEEYIPAVPIPPTPVIEDEPAPRQQQPRYNENRSSGYARKVTQYSQIHQEDDMPDDNGYNGAVIEDDGLDVPEPSSGSSWIPITLAIIGSLALGCLLYLI